MQNSAQTAHQKGRAKYRGGHRIGKVERFGDQKDGGNGGGGNDQHMLKRQK
ncbi:hypothetical protein LTSEALA_5163 [Salmonella enterica subsp. enterica serovar Alachua str. R6-377]|uniref:Uncharacterized protein n=1 Tax=Salmonella enterica subsp. enterica serovar Alachua str. R6-377 TaxID=913241 RepID=G5LV69_SALET|nr:hypothetical protein LTSEALA_5163 [Salmonella enterica subsp. enterica serovar Alachua str. R6-377]